jgi:hypothetical protein
MPQPPPGLLAQLHQELGQFPWVSGLVLEGIGVAEAFPLEVNGVDLVAPKPRAPSA